MDRPETTTLDEQISYIISSIAPLHINETMWKIRNTYKADPPQIKKFNNSIVTLDTAHITIKRRFYLKNLVKDEELITTLDTIAKKPIFITSKRIDVFKSKRLGNVIVALIEYTEGLKQLHADVLQALYPYIESATDFEGTNYNPHLSIMYSIPDKTVNQVKQTTETTILPLTYNANNFYLLKNIPGIKRERAIVKAYNF